MINQKLAVCVFATTVMVAGYLFAQQNGQVTQFVPGPFAKPAPTLPGQTAVVRSVPSWRTATTNGWLTKDVSETGKALQKFSEAESDEEKSEAKKELREALTSDYDARMDQYDEHIETLEKQLAEMRERLSRRRAAKEEMVDLKLKELIANANGLGWPSGPNSGASALFPSPYPVPHRFEAATMPKSQSFFRQEMKKKEKAPSGVR